MLIDKRQEALDFLKKHYDTSIVCPYCMTQVRGSQMSCCGESSDHFEKEYVEMDGSAIDEDEFVKNFDLDRERAKFLAETGREAS
jgi:hypothetical protein